MKQVIASLRSGNWKALLACFLYFDTGFTAWVMFGPLAPYVSKQLSLSPTQAGFLVAVPVLSASIVRVTLGNLFKRQLAPENQNQKVYFGGPVDLTAPLLVVRTTRPPKQAIRLWNNIYGVVDTGSISEILRDARSSNDTRLYLGRAQWAREQLRGELLEGAWSVVPVRTDLIFEHDSAKVWRMLSQHEHVREIDTNCWGTRGLVASTMCREHLTGNASMRLQKTVW